MVTETQEEGTTRPVGQRPSLRRRYAQNAEENEHIHTNNSLAQKCSKNTQLMPLLIYQNIYILLSLN